MFPSFCEKLFQFQKRYGMVVVPALRTPKMSAVVVGVQLLLPHDTTAALRFVTQNVLGLHNDE